MSKLISTLPNQYHKVLLVTLISSCLILLSTFVTSHSVLAQWIGEENPLTDTSVCEITPGSVCPEKPLGEEVYPASVGPETPWTAPAPGPVQERAPAARPTLQAPAPAPAEPAPQPVESPMIYDGPDCVGKDSVWVKKWADGGVNVDVNYGQVPGECGNPKAEEPRQEPKVEETWEGAGCEGNHSIWGVWSKDGSRLLQLKKDHGVVGGECGNAHRVVRVEEITKGDLLCKRNIHVRADGSEYPGGDYDCKSIARTTPPTPPRDVVREVIRREVVAIGAPQTPQTPQTPQAPQTPQTPQAPQTPQTPQTPQAPAREVIIREVRTERVGEVVCPAGSEKRIRDSVVECVVRTTTTQPTVVTTQVKGISEVKELPKTGIPLLAWGLTALIPLGVKLRRFNDNNINNINTDYLWRQRQFLKS